MALSHSISHGSISHGSISVTRLHRLTRLCLTPSHTAPYLSHGSIPHGSISHSSISHGSISVTRLHLSSHTAPSHTAPSQSHGSTRLQKNNNLHLTRLQCWRVSLVLPPTLTKTDWGLSLRELPQKSSCFCRDRSLTNTFLSRQKYACRDKSFVATKMILVAAHANDWGPRPNSMDQFTTSLGCRKATKQQSNGEKRKWSHSAPAKTCSYCRLTVVGPSPSVITRLSLRRPFLL